MEAPSRHEEEITAAGRDLALALLEKRKAGAQLLDMAAFASCYSDEKFDEPARRYAKADDDAEEALLRLKTWIKGERDGKS